MLYTIGIGKTYRTHFHTGTHTHTQHNSVGRVPLVSLRIPAICVPIICYFFLFFLCELAFNYAVISARARGLCFIRISNGSHCHNTQSNENKIIIAKQKNEWLNLWYGYLCSLLLLLQYPKQWSQFIKNCLMAEKCIIFFSYLHTYNRTWLHGLERAHKHSLTSIRAYISW